ncbi:hypothetical protein ACQKWADRAFT_315137 [Trichoderma austrokoningii]
MRIDECLSESSEDEDSEEDALIERHKEDTYDEDFWHNADDEDEEADEDDTFEADDMEAESNHDSDDAHDKDDQSNSDNPVRGDKDLPIPTAVPKRNT